MTLEGNDFAIAWKHTYLFNISPLEGIPTNVHSLPRPMAGKAARLGVVTLPG